MSNDPIKLSYTEPKLSSAVNNPPPRAPRLEDLWGTIRVVAAAPDWTPRGRFADSFALYSNAGTFRLYFYDHEGAAWHYASLT